MHEVDAERGECVYASSPSIGRSVVRTRGRERALLGLEVSRPSEAEAHGVDVQLRAEDDVLERGEDVRAERRARDERVHRVAVVAEDLGVGEDRGPREGVVAGRPLVRPLRSSRSAAATVDARGEPARRLVGGAAARPRRRAALGVVRGARGVAREDLVCRDRAHERVGARVLRARAGSGGGVGVEAPRGLAERDADLLARRARGDAEDVVQTSGSRRGRGPGPAARRVEPASAPPARAGGGASEHGRPGGSSEERGRTADDDSTNDLEAPTCGIYPRARRAGR